MPNIEAVLHTVDPDSGELPSQTIWAVACWTLAQLQLYSEAPGHDESRPHVIDSHRRTKVGTDLTRALGDVATNPAAAPKLAEVSERRVRDWASKLVARRVDFETTAVPNAYGHPTGQRVVDIFESAGQAIVWSPPMQWFEAPGPPGRTFDPAWLV